jgi:acyl dehydratase
VHRRYWEDFIPGDVIDCGSRQLARDEIVAFAAEFDPQPMHLDEASASKSMLGGLAASGWHSCCVLMRMLDDGLFSQSHFLGAPGVEEVKWIAPVRPGEAMTAQANVLETRASRSRPEMGFVRFRFELRDGVGAPLMTMTASPMFERVPLALTKATRPQTR